ncbi:MAG: metal-dependent transcriptional regulator [Candidatus Bathyarchaeota archaeon]|nr:metal-dependent transcriptional regulator [Candidatus Bathyarchaeum tardum]WGM88617.1 MAG: metal-dependent transcriptional regulator [Candidatus Bathyarchaeum tardum]WNZ29127.1 MAG: metal-dependent transcriptional regulator [Candidatus Bathyarchaeota archaeon]
MNSKEIEVTNQAEEYLEAIYRLENKTGFARTMDLSRELGVVPGSITNTVENLERKQLVVHEPYKGVKLTPSGRKIASSILRRHRLAERLLTDFLQIDWSEVHDPACKLEHALTPEILKPLEKALGHPKTCPHGNPIPTDCGGIYEGKTVALTDLRTNTRGVIVKITEEKPEILKELARLNLTPEEEVKIVNKMDENGLLEIWVRNQSCSIEQSLASIIFVEKLET